MKDARQEMHHLGFCSNGSSGKTVGSSTRRNIAASFLSPISSISEFPHSTTSPRKTSKSGLANTPLRRPDLMYPLHSSTPKVTSSSMTSLRRGDVSTTTLSKGQRATTSGVVVSSSTKRTAGDACRRPDLRGKLRFVCSGLTAAQVANVQKFARLHNADYAQQFDPAVTHVIVNTSGADNAAKSTLKYLQGIAHRKWVVSFKWIEDCIARRTLLAEDPYEATTQSVDVNGPGPRNSRLSNRGLFEDFAFLCIGPYENVSLAQYQVRLFGLVARVFGFTAL